ncbi:MAG: MarR family transcriptional regulator [Actinomycetota bacterium]|nr:MarR family transcriptional regulator [Actinomycetota bacterium]
MSSSTATDLDPLTLERQVCFALGVANRAVLGVYRPLLEPLGLTHPQYLVMLVLWDHRKSANPPLSVKQIAKALRLDSATLSPMLKRLETLGLVTRTRSTVDERAMNVELTEDGIALREQALAIPPAVVARLGGDLAELEELHRTLTRINSAAAGALDL